MKISKKINLYIGHLFYFFFYFAICLSISILHDIYSSNTNKLEITSNYLLIHLPFPAFFWIYHTISGKLTKRINTDFEKEHIIKTNLEHTEN